MIQAAIISAALVALIAACTPNILRVVASILIAHADAIESYREGFLLSHRSAGRHLGLEKICPKWEPGSPVTTNQRGQYDH